MFVSYYKIKPCAENMGIQLVNIVPCRGGLDANLSSMGIHGIRVDGYFTEVRTGLRSVWTAICENRAVCVVRQSLRYVGDRWRLFCFTRRLYAQACRADGAVSASETSLVAQDLTECLLQRSIPAKLHALVQLRVASQIVSLPEITAKAEACRGGGWSDDQIRAAMASHSEKSFSESEVLVLRYADEMTRTPMDVDPQTVRELRRYFSPSDLIELTAAIAHEN